MMTRDIVPDAGTNSFPTNHHELFTSMHMVFIAFLTINSEIIGINRLAIEVACSGTLKNVTFS
jgi:hypothetical protein